jgi:hypothetical protein
VVAKPPEDHEVEFKDNEVTKDQSVKLRSKKDEAYSLAKRRAS